MALFMMPSQTRRLFQMSTTAPPPPQPENRKWNREKSTSEGLVNENDAEALRTMTDVDVDV